MSIYKEEKRVYKRISLLWAFCVTFLTASMILTSLFFVSCSKTSDTIPDLIGEWKQINSNNDDSYQFATIVGETIEIYWVSDGGDSKSLYWAGTFVPPTKAGEYSWNSKNDHTKTDSSLLASSDEYKTITYKDGVLSYEASALGTTKVIKLKKQ